MDLRTGLLRALNLPGLDPQSLATEFGKAQARKLISERMEARIPNLAGEMRKAGRTLDKTPEAEWVRDALFRLWRSQLPFPGGGRLADLIRDSHDDKIIQAVADTLTPETTAAAGLRIVRDATLRLLF